MVWKKNQRKRTTSDEMAWIAIVQIEIESIAAAHFVGTESRDFCLFLLCVRRIFKLPVRVMIEPIHSTLFNAFLCEYSFVILCMRPSGDRDIQIYDANFIGAIKMCTICEYDINAIHISRFRRYVALCLDLDLYKSDFLFNTIRIRNERLMITERVTVSMFVSSVSKNQSNAWLHISLIFVMTYCYIVVIITFTPFFSSHILISIEKSNPFRSHFKCMRTATQKSN